MKEFVDEFAWNYGYLKAYDFNIIHNIIPFKHGTKPFRKKLKQGNPILLPIIEEEFKKLLDAKVIVLLIYLEWVANLVPIIIKNGEIRLCVDFINLNKCSLKDNYPLPKINHILQRVVGAQRRFSGYN